MLVKSRFVTGDIIGLKLITGEELLVKLDDETEKTYIITKPMTIVPSQTGVALMQTMISSKNEKPVSIQKLHVLMATADCDDRLLSHYTETTTGIQVVPKGSIIT